MFFTKIHAEYKHFIKAQLELTHQLNESNITQEEIKKIALEQKLIYVKALEKTLENKKSFLDQPKLHQEELFILNKLVKNNRIQGNKYAVIRDEVLIKSYQIRQIQNRTFKHIIRTLDHYKLDEFDTKMNDEFAKNQEKISKINSVDYKPFLKLKGNSKILKQAQQNIRDFYALIEINADSLRYLAIFEKRMYRLNKYKKYNILSMALYLDNTEWGKRANTILYPYNLSIVKLPLILLISLFLYLIRSPLYKLIGRLLSRINFLHNYSNELMSNAYRPINLLFITINIDLALYIYYDFYSDDMLTRFFYVVYAILLTFIVYRILNSIAAIRILEIDKLDQKIKSEMVNVGIKIINFLILIMGILLVMHFAGADLATVLSGLGIGGFAIAIAARESLSNFLGTISILMSDTFSQGDWIVVNGEQGTVVEIGLRVTTLRTFDNALVAIPNGTIANEDVKNWDRRTIGRRIKMSLGVKYNSKAEDIRHAVEEIREMLQNHPDIATAKTSYDEKKRKSTKLVSKEDSNGVKRTLLVFLDEFSDSSINILVYCFSRTTDWEKWLTTKEDVMYKMMDILEKNNLEFAFPSMSLYHQNQELPVPV